MRFLVRWVCIILGIGLFSYTIIFSKGVYYSFDETIVTQISLLPLSDLFHTVKTEPHPFGYYLFLKLLPVNNPPVSKILVMIVSIFLFIGSVWYAQSNKIIFKYKLGFPLLIFVSSSLFWESVTILKQDSLAMPLFVLFVFSFLSSWGNEKRIHWWIMNLSLTFQFFILFRYYLFALLLIIGTVFYFKGKKFLDILVFQFILLTIYGGFYGIEQFQYNYTRFAWTQENTNSFLDQLSISLSGVYSNFISDIQSVVFFLLMGIFIFLQARKYLYQQIVLLVTVILLILGYFLDFYVRARYSFPLFVLLVCLAGWGLQRGLTIFATKKYLALFVFLLFFIPAFSISIIKIQQTSSYYKKYKDVVEKQFSEGSVALLVNNPTRPYVDAIRMQKQDELISFGYNLEKTNNMSVYRILREEGEPLSLTKDEIESRLSNQADSYLYIWHENQLKSYYDPSYLVLNVLMHNCRDSSLTNIGNKENLYIFSNCW